MIGDHIGLLVVTVTNMHNQTGLLMVVFTNSHKQIGLDGVEIPNYQHPCSNWIAIKGRSYQKHKPNFIV
jgi:hypothetical protein